MTANRLVGLALAVLTAAIWMAREHAAFRPYEVYGVADPIWITGYFEAGRSLLPWAVPFGLAAAVAALLAFRGAPGLWWAEAGRSRTLLWLTLTLVLFSLTPGRPAGVMMTLAMALTLPWGIALLALRPPLPVSAGPLPACVFAFAVTLLFGKGVLGGLPHIHDSITYYLHGKMMAAGRLAWDLPASIEPYFHFPFMTAIDGRQVPMHPPGCSVFFAIGHAAGVPWLVGPMLTAGCVLLVHAWTRRVASEKTARAAAWLAAVSPFAIVCGGEYMSHTAALFTFLLFLYGLDLAATGAGGAGWSFVSGAAMGWCVACRPLTGLAVTAPMILEWLPRLPRKREFLVPRALGFALGTLATLGPLLAMNAHLTGSPLEFPLSRYFRGTYHYGFGPGNLGNDHWPERGLAHTLANVNALNKMLFEWPIPSLAFVYLVFLHPRRPDRHEVRALLPAAGLAFVYFFHYNQDLCVGPRYLFEGVGLLFFLTARGLERLGGRPLAGALAGFTLFGAVLYGPGMVRFFGGPFSGHSQALAEEVRPLGDADLVLVPEELWLSAYPLQPADPERGLAFALDLPDKKPLLEHFRGRRLWRARARDGRVELTPVLE